MGTEVTTSPVHYRLLSEHFQACAELSEKEREKYLSGPTIKDHSLRDELKALLQFHVQPPRPEVETPRPVDTVPDVPVALRGFRWPVVPPVVILGVSMMLLALGVRF